MILLLLRKNNLVRAIEVNFIAGESPSVENRAPSSIYILSSNFEYKKDKMQPFAHLVKESLPNYLAGLPIPDSIGGWFKLGFRDWLALIPPTAALAGFTYITYRAFCPHGRPCPTGAVNSKILKSSAKVVDTINIEDIADKAVLCRCWKTKNWPYCDGSHGDHNKETGDNVGPVIVKHK